MTTGGRLAGATAGGNEGDGGVLTGPPVSMFGGSWNATH